MQIDTALAGMTTLNAQMYINVYEIDRKFMLFLYTCSA